MGWWLAVLVLVYVAGWAIVRWDSPPHFNLFDRLWWFALSPVTVVAWIVAATINAAHPLLKFVFIPRDK